MNTCRRVSPVQEGTGSSGGSLRGGSGWVSVLFSPAAREFSLLGNRPAGVSPSPSCQPPPSSHSATPATSGSAHEHVTLARSSSLSSSKDQAGDLQIKSANGEGRSVQTLLTTGRVKTWPGHAGVFLRLPYSVNSLSV